MFLIVITLITITQFLVFSIFPSTDLQELFVGVLNNKCFSFKWEGLNNFIFIKHYKHHYKTFESMMLKGFKIFQWLYSENPYIRMNLLFPLPTSQNLSDLHIFKMEKCNWALSLFCEYKVRCCCKIPTW